MTVTVATRELVVAVDEVPEEVDEQAAAPAPANAVNAPGGIVAVRETCVPETVPVIVPVIGFLAAPTNTTNAPVALLPLCVAVQVTGFAAPVDLVRVPDHVPAKLSVVEGVVVEPLHPDVRSAAKNTVSAEI